MTYEEFITRFQLGLGPSEVDDVRELENGRPAAVLIPIVKHEQQATVLLTQRALHLKHHPGQISFPGGGVEANESHTDAAIRETFEEVGVCPSHIEVVGSLPLFKTISKYQVKPIVGALSPNFTTNIDRNEVSEAFEIPLEFAINKNNFITHIISRQGYDRKVYFLPWGNKMIWGATAAMLHMLAHCVAE